MRWLYSLILLALVTVALTAPTSTEEEPKPKTKKDTKKTAVDLKRGMFVMLDGRPTKVTQEDDDVVIEGEDIFKGKEVKATLKKSDEIPVLAKVIKEWRLIEVKDKRATLAALKGDEKRFDVGFLSEDLLQKVLEATEEGKELLVSVLTLGGQSRVEGLKVPKKETKKKDGEEEKKEKEERPKKEHKDE